MSKTSKVYILIMLLVMLILPVNSYAQGQANKLTLPLANRLFLALDGSTDPVTGEIEFQDDIYSSVESVVCEDQTVQSMSLIAVPLDINGEEYSFAETTGDGEGGCLGCGVGAMTILVDDGTLCPGGGGFGMCAMEWTCCQSQSSVTFGSLAGENAIKGIGISVYGIIIGPIKAVIYSWEEAVNAEWFFDNLMIPDGAVVAYQIKNIFSWNATTCEWDYDSDAVALPCSDGCELATVANSLTFSGTPVSWSPSVIADCGDNALYCNGGDNDGQSCSTTNPDCPDGGGWASCEMGGCNNGTYDGSPPTFTSNFIANSTYYWDISPIGDAQLASLEINHAYSFPTVTGTAGQALILEDTETIAFTNIDHLVDRTDGTVSLYLDRDGSDPTIEDSSGNEYLKFDTVTTQVEASVNVLFPTNTEVNFRDSDTRIWSNAEGQLNFESGGTDGIFNFSNPTYLDYTYHPMVLGNAYGAYGIGDGKLLDGRLMVTDVQDTGQHVGLNYIIQSNMTEDRFDTDFITAETISAALRGEGRLRGLSGLELITSSNSGRVRTSEFDSGDVQMTWGPGGLTSTTHNFGDCIREQYGFKATNYLREGAGQSGQAGITVTLSGFISDQRMGDGDNGNIVIYGQDFLASSFQMEGNSYVSNYVASFTGSAPSFSAGSTGYVEEYRGLTLNTGYYSGTGYGTKNFYGVIIKSQNDILNELIGIEVEDQSGSGASGDILSIKVANDILADVDSDTDNFNFLVRRSRDAYSNLLEDDEILGIHAYGIDEVHGDYNSSAAILFKADGDHGSDDNPGRIELWATPDADNELDLIQTIDSLGITLHQGRFEHADASGTVGFFGVTPSTRAAALTTTLDTVTSTGSGTPDYAIAALTASSPYGFASADEGETVLEVLINLQARVNELETKLQAYGLLQ